MLYLNISAFLKIQSVIATGRSDLSQAMFPKSMFPEINRNFYGDFPSVSDVRSNILNELHYLWKSQAKLTMKVKASMFFKKSRDGPLIKELHSGDLWFLLQKN
jgi:hypothetical protein